MALHLAEVRMAFGEMAKGTRFDYDPETDDRITKLIEIGLVVDLGEDIYEQGETEDVSVANPGRSKKVKADDVKAEEPAE